MDELEAAQFANDMARFYQRIAQMIGDQLHNSIGNIPFREAAILSQDQIRLISYSNTFFTLSDQIAFEGADIYFRSAKNATAEVTDAIHQIKTVNDIVSIAAGIIGLAGGIISQNGTMITGSITAIYQAVRAARRNPTVTGEVE